MHTRGLILAMWLLVAAVIASPGAERAGKAITAEEYARKVSSLVDPGKLATLGKRGANQRVQKYTALLAEAEAAGLPAEKVANEAVRMAGMTGAAVQVTEEVMVRNLMIARRLGCLDAAGLSDMRKGQSPTIKKGPFKGDELSVDHIIPRAVVAELDNVIANLELMPLKANSKKQDKIGDRQRSWAKRLREAGLLSEVGLKAVMEFKEEKLKR